MNFHPLLCLLVLEVSRISHSKRFGGREHNFFYAFISVFPMHCLIYSFIVAMTISSAVSAGFMGLLYINLINVPHESPMKYNLI